jgi:Acyl-CoA dehydrogenase, C-terminal domain
MNFEPTEEQASILEGLSRVLAPYRSVDAKSVIQRTIYATALEHTLRESGFLDVGAEDAEARMSAALIVAEIATLPVCIEAMASILIRPVICPGSPGPIAILSADSAVPTRFLPQAKTALILDEDCVRLLALQPADIEAAPTLFAYPVARLTPSARERARTLTGVSAETLGRLWQIGIALEIYGALTAAHRLTLDHVTNRRQFGRPLGALQALQHRLSMNAMNLEAIRWLALRAVFSESIADAAMAAAYAQHAVTTIVYDVHQFSGAMGLTLEYPLHLYTYRARMLLSECGGAHAHIETTVNCAWPCFSANQSRPPADAHSTSDISPAQGPVNVTHAG